MERHYEQLTIFGEQLGINSVEALQGKGSVVGQAQKGSPFHDAYIAEGEEVIPNNGWIEMKTIRGHQYRYLRWREGGKLRSKYLGVAKLPIVPQDA